MTYRSLILAVCLLTAACDDDAPVATGDAGPDMGVAPAPDATATDVTGVFDEGPAPIVPAMLKFSATSGEFMATQAGCPSVQTLTFTLTNVGGAPSGVVSVAIDKPFAIAEDACTGKTLAMAQTCTIGVQYRPETAGMHTGNLSARATPGGQVQVSLSGRAVVGDPVGSGGSQSFDFGSVAVGATSAAKTASVRNLGGSPLPIKEVSLSGAEFALGRDECTGKTLAPGTPCEVDVVFKPMTAGAKTGVLTIKAMACGEQTVLFTLVGTGT